MVRTLRDVCGAPTSVVWHTETSLPAGTDVVALPGGFSYGDYLRCGAIAKVSPIVPAISAHAARGGWVLGVCNGFQILTEVGLLPGALTRNVNQRFECGDWFVRVAAEGPFTPRHDEVWRLPVAHGEGRYQADEATLKRLEGEGLIGLRYCARDGFDRRERQPQRQPARDRRHLRWPSQERLRPHAPPRANERGHSGLRRRAKAVRGRTVASGLRARHLGAVQSSTPSFVAGGEDVSSSTA